jgi:polyhydroxyalkanoate synthesis regulator phasin
MKHLKTKLAAMAAGAAATALCILNGHGQSAEALMDALVRKGILTEQEAEDIKADLAKENRQYVKVRSAGKETVSLDIYGDVRARIEGFYSDDPAMVDRTRFRYRLRVGAVATLFDRFEAGLRLTSSEAAGGFGGDPISGNTTFQDNGSKKFVYIDLAYGRWYAFTNASYLASLTVGKMENPFVLSDMVFDGDYTPEGAGFNFTYNPSLDHALKLNIGGFVLDEIGGQSEDPYMVGAQLRWDATWKFNEAHAPKIQSSIGLGALAIMQENVLTNGAVPNINRGNTRLGGAGVLAYHYNPIVADASFTYTLDKAPLYNGTFPIRVAGDFIYNTAAPTDNEGFSFGPTFGKAGKRGNWEFSYRWKYLSADAWYEEVVDSDFGAFYQVAQPNSGLGTGYGAGTNVKGHIFKLSYSPFNSIILSATWFKTRQVEEPAGGGDTDMNRLQIDALWKF